MNIELGNNSIYECFKYPAGELQVRLTERGIERVEFTAKSNDHTFLIARDLNPERIMELILLDDALRQYIPSTRLTVILPYLPYSRADRAFTEGDCRGLATFTRLLKTLNTERLVSLDVHSNIAQELGVKNITPTPFITTAINSTIAKYNARNINILLPDQGALNRYHFQKTYGCNIQAADTTVNHCRKIRNPKTGSLSLFETPPENAFKQGPILIIDDICDGGATFLGIATQLRKTKVYLPLALYVTHGLFSKGTNELSESFNSILTTDSFSHNVNHITRIPCVQYIVKQNILTRHPPPAWLSS